MKKQEGAFVSPKGQLIPFISAEAVAFPGQILRLHVRISAYLQLLRICEQNEKTFGVLPIIEHQLFGYGCTVSIVSIERKNDGSAMVTLCGKKVFRLVEFFNENECDDETFPVGLVKYLQQNTHEKDVFLGVYEKVFNLFCKITSIFREKAVVICSMTKRCPTL